jgi:hypothetical protein
MGPSNLAIVFGPTLLAKKTGMFDMNQIEVVTLMIALWKDDEKSEGISQQFTEQSNPNASSRSHSHSSSSSASTSSSSQDDDWIPLPDEEEISGEEMVEACRWLFASSPPLTLSIETHEEILLSLFRVKHHFFQLRTAREARREIEILEKEQEMEEKLIQQQEREMVKKEREIRKLAMELRRRNKFALAGDQRPMSELSLLTPTSKERRSIVRVYSEYQNPSKEEEEEDLDDLLGVTASYELIKKPQSKAEGIEIFGDKTSESRESSFSPFPPLSSQTSADSSPLSLSRHSQQSRKDFVDADKKEFESLNDVDHMLVDEEAPLLEHPKSKKIAKKDDRDCCCTIS